MGINFSKHNRSTATQEHKYLRGNPFSLKRKTTGKTLNNFTILNRDYNTWRYNLSKKKKTLSFFSLTALFLNVYLSQFSLSLYIFLFSFACSHAHNSPRLHCPQSHSLGILFLLTSRMASPCISSSFPSFLPFTVMTSNHNKCNSLAFSQFLFSSALP